jgi:hypothetical protein
LHSIADAMCFGHSAFASRYVELRRFAAKNFQAVENDRETSSPSGPGQIQRSVDQVCLTSQYFGAEMDPLGEDEIERLFRLKRYEQPPADYFENFLSEFRRRQRDELLRQPVWRICFDRAHGFALRHNVRPYPAGVVAVVACTAVISIRIYQQPDTTQFAVQSSPVPTRSPNTEKELDFASPAVPRTFNPEPILLPRRRVVPMLPDDSLRSNEFVSLKPEWESLDDQLLPRE